MMLICCSPTSRCEKARSWWGVAIFSAEQCRWLQSRHAKLEQNRGQIVREVQRYCTLICSMCLQLQRGKELPSPRDKANSQRLFGDRQTSEDDWRGKKTSNFLLTLCNGIRRSLYVYTCLCAYTILPAQVFVLSVWVFWALVVGQPWDFQRKKYSANCKHTVFNAPICIDMIPLKKSIVTCQYTCSQQLDIRQIIWSEIFSTTWHLRRQHWNESLKWFITWDTSMIKWCKVHRPRHSSRHPQQSNLHCWHSNGGMGFVYGRRPVRMFNYNSVVVRCVSSCMPLLNT